MRNGKYGLIEIKLGGKTLTEEGAESLKTMQAKIDTHGIEVKYSISKFYSKVR